MTQPRATRIYLAGPLFTQAEWQWNERLAAALGEQALDVVLPQRGAAQMLSGAERFDPGVLFQRNIASIDGVDMVVAIFDGADVDSGTAWECGYAYKSGKPVIGVRADIRAGGDDPTAGVNLMLSLGCAAMTPVPLANRVDVVAVAAQIADAVRRIGSH